MCCTPAIHKHVQNISTAMYSSEVIGFFGAKLQALQQHFLSPNFKAFTDKVCNARTPCALHIMAPLKLEGKLSSSVD